MITKQSTALTVVVGPILDSTGAEYASAVIGDLSISKNGGTLTAMASAATLTYIANGMYTLVTTAGNMDTLGAVQITCNKATYQMPKMERNVVPASVYDAIITNATNATGGLPTATAAITGFAGAISTYAGGAVASVTNPVTVGTNNDKAGYSLEVTPPTASDIADAVLSESVDDHDGVAHSLAKYISIIKKGNTVIDGTVTSAVSPTSTAFASNVNYPTGAFKHAVLLWLTGSLAEQNSPILTYNNTNGVIVVEEAFTQAPTVGDQFVIIPTTHVHSVAAISQGVWSNAGRTLSSFDFQVVVGGYAAGQAPLQSLGVNAPAGWINAASIATDAITNEKIAASAVTKISTGVSNLEVLTRLASMIESDGAGQFRFDTIAVSLAVGGGAGGAVNITVEDRSITVT